MSIADKLTTIAENEQKVYEAGRKKAWDFIQNKGNRIDYQKTFYGIDITDFYPEYNIKPKNASEMFRDTVGNTPIRYDLVERLAECGVEIDFSECTVATYAFYCSAFTHLPVLDFRKAVTTTKYLGCGHSGVKKIDKIILTEDGQSLLNYFGYATLLEEVEIEGKIAGDNLDIKNSAKLTLDSLKSILTALKDYSGTANEYSYTVALRSENWAVLEADGATAPNGQTWIDYVGNKGWLAS